MIDHAHTAACIFRSPPFRRGYKCSCHSHRQTASHEPKLHTVYAQLRSTVGFHMHVPRKAAAPCGACSPRPYRFYASRRCRKAALLPALSTSTFTYPPLTTTRGRCKASTHADKTFSTRSCKTQPLKLLCSTCLQAASPLTQRAAGRQAYCLRQRRLPCQRGYMPCHASARERDGHVLKHGAVDAACKADAIPRPCRHAMQHTPRHVRTPELRHADLAWRWYEQPQSLNGSRRITAVGWPRCTARTHACAHSLMAHQPDCHPVKRTGASARLPHGPCASWPASQARAAAAAGRPRPPSLSAALPQ